MHCLRFYKTPKSLWYVDLPNWQGDPEDLQMIQGADAWLDLLAGEQAELCLNLSAKVFEGAQVLTLIRLGEENLGGGGNYWLEKYLEQQVDLKVWLCEVTTAIFGEYPQKIYFSKSA